MNCRNILVITYWDFNDALIQTYTLPYLEIISKYIPHKSYIYLVCLNKKRQKQNWNHPKIKLISLRYVPYGFRAFLLWGVYLIYLLWIILLKKINIIHAWCTPAGTFAYILSKITRKDLIIDSYEPHAESMVECGEWTHNSLAYKTLFFFEKKMTHHAKYLIATTKGMIDEYAPSRYQYNPSKNNYFIKPACVDVNKFNPNHNKKELRTILNISPTHIVGIYAGKLGGIYLNKEFFDIVKIAYQYWNEKFRLILLSNIPDREVQNHLDQLNIPGHILVKKFVPHQEVNQYLSIANFAITPVKPVYTKKFCSPIKNGEYWAMGLPVLITKNISCDSEIIEKYNIGAVIKELNDTEYLKAIQKIDELLNEDKTKLQQKIRNIALKYRSLSIACDIYKKIYSSAD